MLRRCHLLLVLALSPLAGGCASLSLVASPLSPAPDPVAVANNQEAMVVVEVRAYEKKPKLYQMPLEGQMHVQDAVDKSRARKKFRRMNVAILRTAPDGRRHKMECQYDVANRRVAPEFDYAIQQGDYIVISEDPTTMLEEMLSAAGPLKMLRR